jgi:hypothetical protein
MHRVKIKFESGAASCFYTSEKLQMFFIPNEWINRATGCFKVVPFLSSTFYIISRQCEFLTLSKN